jgi:hypothetical protein
VGRRPRGCARTLCAATTRESECSERNDEDDGAGLLGHRRAPFPLPFPPSEMEASGMMTVMGGFVAIIVPNPLVSTPHIGPSRSHGKAWSDRRSRRGDGHRVKVSLMNRPKGWLVPRVRGRHAEIHLRPATISLPPPRPSRGAVCRRVRQLGACRGSSGGIAQLEVSAQRGGDHAEPHHS